MYQFRLLLGEQGWRSGESARLPPMCPGFDSRTRRHMWIEFVVGSRPCSKGFLLVLWFSSLLKKPTFLNSNSIENSRATGLSVEELLCVTLVKQSQFIYLFIYFTWLQMELFKLNHEVLKVIVGSLSTRVLRRGRQPEENISHAWTIMSPRFFYYLSLMAKRY